MAVFLTPLTQAQWVYSMGSTALFVAGVILFAVVVYYLFFNTAKKEAPKVSEEGTRNVIQQEKTFEPIEVGEMESHNNDDLVSEHDPTEQRDHTPMDTDSQKTAPKIVRKKKIVK